MADAVGQADGSDLFSDEEKALIAFAAELTATARVSEETYERARRSFDERALVELVVATSVANLNNRVTDAFLAEVQDEE